MASQVRLRLLPVLLLGAALSVARAPALEFQFHISVEGAGTRETKQEELPGGKPLIFPVDEFDLAGNLKPALAEFRKKRRESAKSEAVTTYRKIKDSEIRIDLIVKAGEVLDSDELSDDFYEHYQAELETIKKILTLWVVYSQDVSRVKLWNGAMRKEIRDPRYKGREFQPLHLLLGPARGRETGPAQPDDQALHFSKGTGDGIRGFRPIDRPATRAFNWTFPSWDAPAHPSRY